MPKNRKKGAVKKVPINKSGAGLTGVDTSNGEIYPPSSVADAPASPQGEACLKVRFCFWDSVSGVFSKKVDILLTKGKPV